MYLRFLDAKILLVIVALAWATHEGIVKINFSQLKKALGSIVSASSTVIKQGKEVINISH